MKIAYAGAPGAFAHEACLAFAGDHEPIAVESFADVVGAVETGKVQRGMLPLHNKRAGTVRDVAALLGSRRVAIEREYALPVRMHLLALPSASLADIQVVSSHPMALAQCACRLASLGIRLEPASNTAVAARDLSSPDRAAVASEAAASFYGLQVLLHDLQDDIKNCTHFGLIVRLAGEATSLNTTRIPA